MRHLPRKLKLAIGVALCVFLGACVAFRAQIAGPPDRGVRFNHALHAEQGIGCADCHDMSTPETTIPGHDVCSICHEIPEDEPTAETCGLCHTRPDYTVDSLISRFRDEIIWSHDPHLAADVDCTTCHAEPDKRVIPPGDTMAWCMDCHGTHSPQLNECSVCHRELREDVVPKFRGDTRIAHDSPQVWQKVHGREARINEKYCSICHDVQNDCETCHRITKPDSHTMSFVRKTHGLQATWDRNKCTVCHEEDSCLKCHQNTKPTSHRGGFDSPVNSHCVQCHYPPQSTSCTVCHESIEHRSARPSPHILGIYPPNCAQCHPGGLPLQAPHIMNSTVRCIVCHN
jgi:hypothetical protein